MPESQIQIFTQKYIAQDFRSMTHTEDFSQGFVRVQNYQQLKQENERLKKLIYTEDNAEKIFDVFDENIKLKSQIAEKDKEIENLKSFEITDESPKFEFEFRGETKTIPVKKVWNYARELVLEKEKLQKELAEKDKTIDYLNVNISLTRDRLEKELAELKKKLSSKPIDEGEMAGIR